jgi:serine protease Do
MHKRRFLSIIITLILALAIILPSSCQLVTKVQDGAIDETTTSTGQQTIVQTSSDNAQVQIVMTQSQPLPSIADVVAAVKPSVVAINVEVLVPGFFGGSTLEEGAGSGWIISSDGLIVTNNHVVADAQSINVTLFDGRSLPVDPSTVFYDEIADLAVLKVNAIGLPAVTIGDSSQMRVGDWVVAIGNSLGEGIRATQGIISRQDVTITDDNGQEISGLLETDAAVNPGNSGGPLVNMAGGVIGIVNAKMIATDVEGVGYAISSNEAVPLINELISKGYVTWPYLGVNTLTVDAWTARQYRLNIDSGVLLTYVDSSSPSSKAGLQEGDVVVKFNGQVMTTAAQLITAIHKASIGSPVEIVFWRGNNQNTTTVVLIERPR